ncbi:astacin-like metalloendopeptidase isoform X2 [Mixophyes fleayi]|uniref:astacin-like metalloendopeptidase isoform X2 n=1 Tax=Mixophyes fleayi TaxID=3061075 RepID=UPI003F4D939A
MKLKIRKSFYLEIYKFSINCSTLLLQYSFVTGNITLPHSVFCVISITQCPGADMARNIVFLISAAVWSVGLTLPIQTDHSTPKFETGNITEDDRGPYSEIIVTANNATGGAEEDNGTIFEVIESANRGVPMLLSEGDIAVLIGRNARKCINCRWGKSSDGIIYIPYVISSSYTDSQKQLITSAMQEFSTMTCVRFIDKTTESIYLQIQDAGGCWSNVGRSGRPQPVSLSRLHCMSYGVVQHELMHALSFLHEHTRKDRDNYVDIIWKFLSPKNQEDFEPNIANPLDIPYDYTSVMQYGRYAFTNTSGMATIVPKPDPTVIIGQKHGLSNLDVKKINELYKCNLCRTKLLGVSGSLSSNDISPKQNNDNCLWLIQMPSDKVLFQLDLFTTSSSSKGLAEINVYDGVDKTSLLLAKISPGQSSPLLISSVLYGATLTTDNGIVVSPKYPSFYPNNVNGTWIIIAPTGYRVSLIFQVFDLESSPSCSCDILVIRDGGGAAEPILGTYCGKISSLILKSSGQMMLLQFSSNLQGNTQGFNASYSFVPAG